MAATKASSRICHLRIAYAPNKIETADWLSRMAGTTTIVKEDVTQSGNRYAMTLAKARAELTDYQQQLENLPTFRAVIAAVHETQAAQNRQHTVGEIYAYPHAGEGIAWGINSAMA
jgi:hypothetical protein